mmetsp:Transcript_7772/g.11150  ORF Transcript_7772/g.11150 Transcript_7772/m.11150 type:complete len:157 (-) Transcript_7772:218-688(-)
MVWGRIRDALSGTPKLDGEAKLPDYFPVEPRGCERHAQKLFTCLAEEATAKARDMEKANLHKSYYTGKQVEPQEDSNISKEIQNLDDETKKQRGLPTANDNPLDECRTLIAYYKRCCDRELKKKQNWILTEPYRVQEEYRYKKQQNGVGGEKATSK